MSDILFFADGVHDDTAALQRLLDQRGEINVATGTYLVTRPLKIHDNTRLRLSCGTVIRLADNANCAIIENDRFDENDVLDRTSPHNKNISVQGGVWDGNNANQVRRPKETVDQVTVFDDHYYFGIFMRFIGVRNFSVCDTVIRDPESFALQISDAEYFTFRDITFDFNCLRSNMDGIHVNGPARFGFISNIQGRTNDDLVALNADDGRVAEITRGPISDIRIDGIYSDCGFNAVRMLSGGSKVSNVSIRNIYGTYRFYIVSFTCEAMHEGEESLIDNILLDGIYASKATHPLPEGCFTYNDENGLIDRFPLISFDSDSRTGQVTIQNMHRVEGADTHAPYIQVRKTASIERLTLRSVSQRFINGKPVALIKKDGVIKELIADNVWLPDSDMVFVGQPGDPK